MRVEVRVVEFLPMDVLAWLVKRAGQWVLYIVEDVLTSLGGTIPGAAEPLAIRPRWRVSPSQ